MTMPSERTRAVLSTRRFLEELCSGEDFVNMPKIVRETARQLLRHYPDAWHIDMAAVAWPQTWAPASRTHAQAPSYLDLLERLKDQPAPAGSEPA
jgi:hypothetical protein